MHAVEECVACLRNRNRAHDRSPRKTERRRHTTDLRRVTISHRLLSQSSGVLLVLFERRNASESMMPRIYDQITHAHGQRTDVRALSIRSEHNYDARTYCKHASHNRADAGEELEEAHTVLLDAEHDWRKRVAERNHYICTTRSVSLFPDSTTRVIQISTICSLLHGRTR